MIICCEEEPQVKRTVYPSIHLQYLLPPAQGATSSQKPLTHAHLGSIQSSQFTSCTFTPHRKHPDQGVEPATFLVWGYSVNHCATMLPHWLFMHLENIFWKLDWKGTYCQWNANIYTVCVCVCLYIYTYIYMSDKYSKTTPLVMSLPPVFPVTRQKYSVSIFLSCFLNFSHLICDATK